MKDLRVYKVLVQLSVYERNRFSKYINSPYFNKQETLSDLFSLIDDTIRNPSKTSKDKKQIWDLIHPKSAFNDNKFRKNCADLIQHIQSFLALEFYQNNPLQQANNLLETVNRERLKPFYNVAVKTARRLSDRQLHQSGEYYYEQYRLEKNIYNITEFMVNRHDQSNIKEIISNLDHFYLAEKLRNHCNLIVRKYYTGKSSESLFIDEIIDQIEQGDFTDIPPIEVYYQMYKMFSSQENEEYYRELKKLVNRHIEIFPDVEAQDLYHSLINYCLRQCNKGKFEYYRELFNIYDRATKDEIIIVDGLLAPWDYKNAILVALRLKEFTWAEKFIKTYEPFLDVKYRENAVRLNSARLFFYKKQYQKVQELLREVEFDDFSYNLSSKAMMLATYFELKEFDPLDSFLNSFSVFINRNKKHLPEQRKINYLNLIKYTRRLMKISHRDEKSIKKLKQEINKEKNIADIRWLKEKITEIES